MVNETDEVKGTEYMKKTEENEFYGIEPADEQARFAEINKIASSRLAAAELRLHEIEQDLLELKEVYDEEDREGRAQRFQKNAQMEDAWKEYLRAKRAGNKPYFGRIDLIDDEIGKKETYYIGKSVLGRDIKHPTVIDWRAPVASIYYEQNLGHCTYRVPGEESGNVDLKRKRTYVIENNKLKDFYDSTVVANDDLLTEYLSKSKKSVLSEIIATIQQEQNEVIRKNPHHNVLIQGSAGSGKTTVAMHRISYILYNYAREFDPKDFYIIGSNKVLLNYITGVLPDLDVYDVSQMTMEELFVRLLYEEWDSDRYSIRHLAKTDRRAGEKGKMEWFEALSKFAAKKIRMAIKAEDIRLEKDQQVILSAANIRKVLNDLEGKPFIAIVERLTDLLMSGLENAFAGHEYTYPAEEQKKLTRHYNSYFVGKINNQSVVELYEEFLARMRSRGVDYDYQENSFDLYDLASLAYLYKSIKETEVIREACHVVVDEAQDFGIAVYASMKYCLSKCTFTIMGDVSQNINFGCGLQDWEELKKLMLPEPYDYFGLLRKSYRNTIEISEFATDILRHGSFPIYPVEPIVRHGNEVKLEKASTEDELISLIAEQIDIYRKEGHETIAVICADETQASRMAKELGQQTDIRMFSEEQSDFGQGVTVLSIEYSKGLEFDAVIIADASEKNYPKNDDYAKLLYVAATRALHELSVFCCGDFAGLIIDPIPENRRNISFAEDDYHKTPYVFEEDTRTKKQIAKDIAREGAGEMARRESLGPKRIETESLLIKEDASKQQTIRHFIPQQNRSTYDNKVAVYDIKQSDSKESDKIKKSSEFNTMPTGTSLLPPGHGRIDHSVRWVDANKDRITITGSYGTLLIIPRAEDEVLIIFKRGNDIAGITEKASGTKWKVIQNRNYVEAQLPKLSVRVDRKSGAVTWLDGKGRELLNESPNVIRQYEEATGIYWNFFAFGKKERLMAQDETKEKWIPLENCARYISHGEAGVPSALMSSKGYQIEISSGIKVLVNTVPAYPAYIRYEGADAIKYTLKSLVVS